MTFPVPSPGEAFWYDITLPGGSSGGRHSCVVLSCDAYNKRTGRPVMAALRQQPANRFRAQVTPRQFTPHPGQSPLDTDRVIGLDQLSSVSLHSGLARHGRVDRACVESALAMVRLQLQIGDPPYTHRGQVWQLASPVDGFSEVVQVLNDRATGTDSMTQVLALPLGSPAQEAPLLMIAKKQRKKLVRSLTPGEQAELDAILLGVFGL